MGVSKNNGTPKSSILIGFPFGVPLFSETSIYYQKDRATVTNPRVLYYSGDGALCYIAEPFALPKVCHPMACKPSLAAPLEFHSFRLGKKN